MSANAFRYAIAFGCALWVLIFATWQRSLVMFGVGVGLVAVTIVTGLVDVRRSEKRSDGRWKE